MNLTLRLTERNREIERGKGGTGSAVERRNKAERCGETDGNTGLREVRARLREGGRKIRRKTGEEKCSEDIFRERGESFCLPARGMTHLLPADRRMDGGKKGGDGQSRWGDVAGERGEGESERDEDEKREKG